jgi:gliding motility-associated-like protein
LRTKKIFLFLVNITFGLTLSYAQMINTIAGNGVSGYSGDGGPATAAELLGPFHLSIDGAGNVLIPDYENNRVRMLNTSGVISTIAGNGVLGYSGDGGPAVAAEMYYVSCAYAAPSGNIYISDHFNNVIRMVNTSGIITTIAGNGAVGYSGNGGPATAAELHTPIGVTADAAGNIYLTDAGNACVRKINTSGIISTIAGNTIPGFSGDGGAATAAEINWPAGIVVNAAGDIFFSDWSNNCIREINPSGIISTCAGNFALGAGYSGNGGQATAAQMNSPNGIALDGAGNIYSAESGNNCIRKIIPSGIISTVAGNTIAGFSGDGGQATAAEMNASLGVAVNSAGDIYISDYDNKRVREITGSITVSVNVIAGVSCNAGNGGSAAATPSGGNSPYTYSWSPGGQTTSTATGLSARIYTITVTDNIDLTASATATITQSSSYTGTTTTTGELCFGSTNASATVIPGGGNPPYNYVWNPGGEIGSSVNGLSAGTYTVTITDANGCTGTASAVVTQPVQFGVAFSSDINEGCSPLCIQFRNSTAGSVTGIQSYVWTFGNGDTSHAENPIYCFSKSGVYSVGLTVTSDSGCSATLKTINMITVYNIPSVAFSVSPQPATILSPTIQFTSQSTDQYGRVEWEWTFGDNSDSTSTMQNPVHTYQDTGSYCAQLTVTDIHGCVDSAKECLAIEPHFTLYIPDAFSPNGDGLNDVFMAKGQYIKNFEMYIFDRWGAEIFYSNSINTGWNGTANGSSTVCQEGTYAYKILVTDSRDKQHSYLGSVAIVK